MFAVFKKEVRQFANNFTGLISVVVFLIINALFLFFFPDTSLLDYGYASLDFFFDVVPYILIQLISSITMKLFAEEYKTGTYELLCTKPISSNQIILGKNLAALVIVLFSLIPSLLYAYSLSMLSVSEVGIDLGAVSCSYLGLIMLSYAFISIGVFCSSLVNNSVVAFLFSCLLCYLIYTGFDQIAAMDLFSNRVNFLLENIGLKFHYQSISKGILNFSDVVYFFSVAFFFIVLTKRQLLIRK